MCTFTLQTAPQQMPFTDSFRISTPLSGDSDHYRQEITFLMAKSLSVR